MAPHSAGNYSISPTVPQLTWIAPASIVYGTPLGTADFDVSANVAGTFVYTPAVGKVLDAGDWTLSVRFLPQDSTDYVPATMTTMIVVSRATPTLSVLAPGGRFNGSPLPASVTIAGVIPGVDNTPSASVGGVGAHAPLLRRVRHLRHGPRNICSVRGRKLHCRGDLRRQCGLFGKPIGAGLGVDLPVRQRGGAGAGAGAEEEEAGVDYRSG